MDHNTHLNNLTPYLYENGKSGRIANQPLVKTGQGSYEKTIRPSDILKKSTKKGKEAKKPKTPWNQVQNVHANQQHDDVHGMKVDHFTASALVKTHKALNPKNQERMVAAINKSPNGLVKMSQFSMGRVKPAKINEAWNEALNEAKDSAYDQMMTWYKSSDEKKVYDILKKNKFVLPAEGFTLVQNMLKKFRNHVKNTSDEIMHKYPKFQNESVELDEEGGPLMKWFDDFRTHLGKNKTDYKNVKPTDMLKLYYDKKSPQDAAKHIAKRALGEAKNDPDDMLRRKVNVATSRMSRTLDKEYGKRKPSRDPRIERERIESASRRISRMGHDPKKMKQERDDVFQRTSDVRAGQKLVAIRKAQKSIKSKSPSVNHPNLRPRGEDVNEDNSGTYNNVLSGGKKLGDHLGKSYYHHNDRIYMLHQGKAVNHGPITDAKNKFNPQLQRKLGI